MYEIKHKSGRTLFHTSNKFTALNRASMGWRVEKMKIKVSRCRNNAKLPTYGTSGAACFDLYAVLDEPVRCCVGEPVDVPTGLKFEIPDGYAMFVYSRSGHGFKHDIRLSNCVGVIDSDYRGEVRVRLTCDVDHYDEETTAFTPYFIQPGERVAQAVIVQVNRFEFEEVCSLSDTERGAGGMGSTGKC